VTLYKLKTIFKNKIFNTYFKKMSYRNYKKEGAMQYGWRQSRETLKETPEGRQQIRNRDAKNKRNAARRLFKGQNIKGKDIDHIDSNPYNNAKHNLRILSVKRNRSSNAKHTKKFVTSLRK
jgi:hypothetical protein